MCLSRKVCVVYVEVTLNSVLRNIVDDGSFLVYPSPLDLGSILFTAYLLQHYYSWSVVSQAC